jgi:hypothetical protein
LGAISLNKTVTQKTSVLQMAFMGVISLTVGVVCLVDTTLVYGLPFITSISASATTGNATGMLLPFALGCMFTFCISYIGYNDTERSIVNMMGIFFLVVAMQITNSSYISDSRVGLLGLSPEMSGTIHMIGAIFGFGLLWVWVTFFFTKSNPRGHKTPRKRLRNKIYYSMGLVMLFGILLLILGRLGAFTNGFPYVWLAEEFILIPAGVAIIVKSGLVLKDNPSRVC